MAVNYRKLQSLMDSKKSGISNAQFFRSRLLSAHFAEMAQAASRRYSARRKVGVQIVWEPKCNDVAFTDNQMIFINAANDLVKKGKTRLEKYHIVTGVFAHELGHILYTNFLMSNTCDNKFRLGIWYPCVPGADTPEDVANLQDINLFLQDEANRRDFIKLFFNINNIIEDGYIEFKMMREYPGSLGYGLKCARKAHFTGMDSMSDMIDKETDGTTHIFLTICQALLSYVKFGMIKYGECEKTDERVQMVFSLIPELDAAIYADSSRERFAVTGKVLVRLWYYAKDFIQTCRDKAEKDAAASGASDSSIDEEVSADMDKQFGSLTGSSKSGTGTTVPVEENSNPEKSESGKPESENDTGNEESESGKKHGNSEEKALPAADGTILETMSEESSGKQTVSDTEFGRLPRFDTSSVSSADDGWEEYDDEYRAEINHTASTDIERILDGMAQKAAQEELEEERLSILQNDVNSIELAPIHQYVNIMVHRVTDVDEDLIAEYDYIFPQLEDISSRLQKTIRLQLRDAQTGGKHNNLMMGRRMDTHAIYRNDGKCFYKTNLPKDAPQLAVALLVDESGSMAGSDRCTYARATAIVLHDFCINMGIPIMIYGHSTGYYNGDHCVDLYSYAEFDVIDGCDKYRLMDISARGSNRDGAALKYVAEQLAKRPETDKILILISDGQPADSGYYGTAAEEDLRNVKQEYVRRNILFIAAAIGADKEDIERIYEDSFFDITDLTQLPVKLTNVIKDHMKI